MNSPESHSAFVDPLPLFSLQISYTSRPPPFDVSSLIWPVLHVPNFHDFKGKKWIL